MKSQEAEAFLSTWAMLHAAIKAAWPNGKHASVPSAILLLLIAIKQSFGQ